MKAIRSVLALTDFSGDSGHALRRAVRVASGQGAALALLHVISDAFVAAFRERLSQAPELEARLIAGAEQALEREAAAVADVARVPITWRVRIGAVLSEMLDAAQAADFVVVGARGANPLKDRLLGTTAERLLGRCPRPVLTVRRAAAGDYRKVLVPVDFTPISAAALETGLRIAPRATVRLCHAVEPLPEGTMQMAGVPASAVQAFEARARQQSLTALQELVQRVSPGDAERVECRVLEGHPAVAILDGEHEYGADLIVIGKQGRSALDTLLGSVTRHVLASAQSDVLVVGGG